MVKHRTTRRRQRAGAKRTHNHSDVTYAVIEGNIEALTQLLTANRDEANMPDWTGNLPLGYAVQMNNIDAARVLIEHGADVNREYDPTGRHIPTSPLYEATKADRVEMVELMMNHGGNPHKSVNYDTPFNHAMKSGSIRMIEMFLGNVDINAMPDGRTLLTTAAGYNRADLVQRLIELGADVNKVNSRGYAPLYFARNNVDIMRILLEHGADPNASNSDVTLPLYIASQNNNLEAIRLLIEHGAKVNIPNSLLTPLHHVTKHNNLEAMRLLIEKGANVNLSSTFPPIYVASENNNLEAMRLLIEKGANVNLPKKGFKPLHNVIKHNNLEAVRLLIEHGADLNAPDLHNYTPLMAAAINNNIDALLYLIDAGATITGDAWRTLFNRSSSETIAAFIRHIEEKGIDLAELRNNTGQTILHEIARSNKISDVERRRLLDVEVAVPVYRGYTNGPTVTKPRRNTIRNIYGLSPSNIERMAAKQRNRIHQGGRSLRKTRKQRRGHH
jgi:ankyrin repeat protein